MKKTIIDWLNELPSPIKERALKGANPEYCDYSKPDATDSLFDAVSCFEDWDNTPEGFDYWASVADNIELYSVIDVQHHEKYLPKGYKN